MEPLYQKVKHYITRRIDAGELKEGERVPSENDLVRSLGLSRMTVHRALRELTDQGVLKRTAGVGTFVALARLQRPATPIRDIAEEIVADGQCHSAELIDRGREFADESLSSVFERSAGAELFHAIVVHRADSSPMLLEDRWVNPSIAPDYLTVDLRKVTTTRYLLETAPVQRVQQTTEAIVVDGIAAGHLALESHEPVLLVRRRTWAHDQVASYADLYYPGSRYTMSDWADDLPRVNARYKHSN